MKKNRYVQIFNPKSKYWIKLDKELAKIISSKKTPYKGIKKI